MMSQNGVGRGKKPGFGELTRSTPYLDQPKPVVVVVVVVFFVKPVY